MVGPRDSQSRTWGMLCHLSSLVGYVFPFGHLLGPLLIWLIRGKEDPFVDEQGKESLNFQLSMTIYLAIAAALIIVLIGIPLLIALGLADLVLVIMASVAANDGRPYHYPMTIRFIR